MRRAVVVAFAVQASALPCGRAAEYGGETQGVTADELAALAAAGELDAEALDALLSLHDEPPEPAKATPEELGLLPGVGRAEARRRAENGENVAGQAAFVPLARADLGALVRRHMAPQAFARLRVAPTAHLAGSVLALTRERVRLETRGDELVSNGPRREVGLERWYAAATFGGLRLIAGNFNCDFADGVTFSSARRSYAPSLDPADAVVRSADARALGAAAALRGLALELDTSVLQATAFASYRNLDLYQYGEWQRDGRSPAIILRGSGEPLRYATLAEAARETLVGGNVDVRFGEQAIGATAYVGTARLTDAAGVWSPSSTYPALPRFGA
ncbi:MAG TPA: hypothetical protein VLC93_18495, partial [Myxococcota bacterium]|nr:hypothetical protein [Myxococcota bacterium]